jgi:hypothetical protein
VLLGPVEKQVSQTKTPGGFVPSCSGDKGLVSCEVFPHTSLIDLDDPSLILRSRNANVGPNQKKHFPKDAVGLFIFKNTLRL